MDEQKEVKLKTEIIEYLLKRFEIKANIGLTERDKAKTVACDIFDIVSKYVSK